MTENTLIRPQSGFNALVSGTERGSVSIRHVARNLLRVKLMELFMGNFFER